MEDAKTLKILLNKELLSRAQAGKQFFLNRAVAAFGKRGFETEFLLNSEEARQASEQDPGLSLFYRSHPTHERSLTLRRVYLPLFWQIERSAQRWEWRVAHEKFEALSVPKTRAETQVATWKNRNFANYVTPQEPGLTYVPLQGKLDTHRSFQFCSPLKMLDHVMAQTSGPVVAGLHPGETYSKQERDALDAVVAQHDRLSLVKGQAHKLLPACDLVVSMNSAVAFSGYFFEKPTVLFAQIDFHHIAGNVMTQGVGGAFEHARRSKPDYAAYLFWFLNMQSINAGQKDAENQILRAARRAGWSL